MNSPDRLPSAGVSMSRRDFLKIFAAAIIPRNFQVPDADRIWLPKPQDEILIKIVNKEFPISEKDITTLIKPNLVNVQEELIKLGIKDPPINYTLTQLHKVVLGDLARTIVDSRKEGLRITICNGFRDIDSQINAFNQSGRDPGLVEPVLIDKNGKRFSTSGHSLGNTLDFSTPGIYNQVGSKANFENEAARLWLDNNGYKYGLVQPYRKDHQGRIPDGMINEEAWHRTYIGVNLASDYEALYKKGLVGSVFEYLDLYKIN